MSDYLFHYTPRHKGCQILRTGTIKLNSFSSLNDPKEVAEWVQYFAGNHLVILRDMYKVLCFSTGLYSGRGSKKPLDSGWGMGNMWAHYANKHDGLCIVFEKAKLSSCFQRHFNNKSFEIFHKSVVYSDDLQLFSDAQANDLSDDQLMNYLIFHKFNWWSNEKEYRWVIKHNNQTDDHLSLECLDAIIAIIIGNNFPVEYRQEVYKLTKNERNFDVGDLGFRNGLPHVSWHT